MVSWMGLVIVGSCGTLIVSLLLGLYHVRRKDCYYTNVEKDLKKIVDDISIILCKIEERNKK